MSLTEKRCPKCGITKQVADYHKNAARHDGLAAYCKPCKKANRSDYRRQNPDLYREKRRLDYLKNKDREQAANSAWAKANREQVNQYSKLWRAKNPEKASLAYKTYAQRNPEKVAAKRFRREGRMAHPISKINPEGMKAPYRLASLMTRLTGEAFHVDHIVPLNGINVSGLHCASNLVPMPSESNLLKGNSFDEHTESSAAYYWRDIVLTLDKALQEGAL